MFHILGTFYASQRWVFEVAALLFFTIICQLGLALILKRSASHANKTHFLIDASFFKAIYGPAIVAVGLFGLMRVLQALPFVFLTQEVLVNYIQAGQKLGFLIVIAWFLISFCKIFEKNLIAHRLSLQKPIDQTLTRALSQLCTIAIMLVVTVVGMQLIGLPISGLLTFGGIGSAAIAFASKDLLTNLFSGLVIYLDRPFSIGEWIQLPEKSIEGTVDHVGMRLTRICTLDKQMLYVPNGVFISTSVQNLSRMKARRIKVILGLRYEDADRIDGICHEIVQYLKSCQDLDQRQLLYANFTGFSSSSLDITVCCFTNTIDTVGYQQIKQSVFLKLIEIIAKHGAECAFETMTLNHRQ